MKNTTLALASLFVLTVACARRDRVVPAPATDRPPAAPVADPRTLAERLIAEAASRPAGAPRVEQVAAALQRAGIELGPMKQVLARTIGARFCMSAQSGAGLGVAVCEFADDVEAARGLAYSRRTFDRLIPNRRLIRNRGTVLTLTGPPSTPALDEKATRAAQVFASL